MSDAVIVSIVVSVFGTINVILQNRQARLSVKNTELLGDVKKNTDGLAHANVEQAKIISHAEGKAEEKQEQKERDNL